MYSTTTNMTNKTFKEEECHCSRTSRYHTLDSNYQHHTFERCWSGTKDKANIQSLDLYKQKILEALPKPPTTRCLSQTLVLPCTCGECTEIRVLSEVKQIIENI